MCDTKDTPKLLLEDDTQELVELVKEAAAEAAIKAEDEEPDI